MGSTKKRIRKANNKSTKGGKTLKKGQSASFNPQFNKYRLEAKHRTMFGVRGEGNLTEAKLALHNKLTTESQCDENEDKMSVGGETAMTVFTNCSLPTFNRLLKNWNSKSFLHKEMLAIIAAVTDVVKTYDGKETETEYFAALITTLDVVDTDESLTAVICLLSMLVKRLNESVLKIHRETVCNKMIKILLDPKYMNSDHCALLRNLLLILHTMAKLKTPWTTHSEFDNKDGANVDYKTIVKCVLEYTIHHKPKVRKVAHQIIHSLLSNDFSESSSRHVAAKLVAEYSIDFLESQGGPTASKEVFYVLALLQEVIGFFPKMKIKAACETIFKVMTLSNAVLSLNCLKTLHCLFTMNPNSEVFPADMNARVINALYNYEPNVNESQTLMCWLNVMEASFINLKLLDEDLCLLHLPTFTARAVKCWLSGKQENLPVVEQTLKNLVINCIDSKSQVFQQLLLEDPVNNSVHKMFHLVERALSYEFHKAWKHVLNVLAIFFQIIGKCSYTVMIKCLRSLADMHDSYKFPHLDELEKAIGAAVQHIGPRIVMEAMPLQINCDNPQPDFQRSWLLPLLRDNIKKTELKFFSQYFLPLAGKLRNKAKQLQQNNRVVESKLYDLTCLQVWSLLPGFCNEPSDLKECFRDVARLLGEVLKDEPSLRLTVLSALRLLITKNLLNKENREELSKYAKNYLPILLNLYTTEAKEKSEEKVRLVVYEAIKTFLQITEKELCDMFFSKALEKLSSAESGTFMQHALIDVCKAMLPYIEESQIKILYDFCKLNLKNDNHTTQKKSYSMMNELCSCEAESCESFVKSNLKDLRPLLCEFIKGLKPSTKALRLNCLKSILNHLTENDKDIITLLIPEAVLCTKENSIKARTAAYNLLVAIGHTMKKIMAKSEKGAIEEYIKILLAGLAGMTPHLISATILAVGKVIYEFKTDLDCKMIGLLVENVCLLMTSRSKEVAVASLSFFKILFNVLDSADLLQHVEFMVKSITNLSQDNQRQLRFKAKNIFTRLVRKFGFEMINKMVPDTFKKQLNNIRKLESRKQRKKDLEDSDSEVKESKKTDNLEDILADSDSELEEEDRVSVKKKAKRFKRNDDPMLEEYGEDDIVDFMDPSVHKRLLTTKPDKSAETKQSAHNFAMSEDGRLIIKDDDEPKKESKISGICSQLNEFRGSNNKKKRKFEDSDDDDKEETSEVKKGIHRTKAKNKKIPGQEYKAKKAGGDLKKGKLEPYAYVPFNRQALNKRKQVKLKGQYKSIVKAAKKGASIGVKRKIQKARRQK